MASNTKITQLKALEFKLKFNISHSKIKSLESNSTIALKTSLSRSNCKAHSDQTDLKFAKKKKRSETRGLIEIGQVKIHWWNDSEYELELKLTINQKL